MDQELNAMITALVNEYLPKVLDRLDAAEARVVAAEERITVLEQKLDELLEIAKGGAPRGRKRKEPAPAQLAEQTAPVQPVEPEASVQHAAPVQPVESVVPVQPVGEVVAEAATIVDSITPEQAALYLSLVQNGYDASDVAAMASYMGTSEDVARFIAGRPVAWVKAMADKAEVNHG